MPDKTSTQKNVHSCGKNKSGANNTKDTEIKIEITSASEQVSEESVNFIKDAVDSMLKFQIKYGFNLNKSSFHEKRK